MSFAGMPGLLVVSGQWSVIADRSPKQIVVGLPHLPLEDLPRGGLRKGVDDHDLLRHLEGRQVFLAQGRDLLLLELLAGLGHHEGDDGLDPVSYTHLTLPTIYS